MTIAILVGGTNNKRVMNLADATTTELMFPVGGLDNSDPTRVVSFENYRVIHRTNGKISMIFAHESLEPDEAMDLLFASHVGTPAT